MHSSNGIPLIPLNPRYFNQDIPNPTSFTSSRARIDRARSPFAHAASSIHRNAESMLAEEEDAVCGVGLVLQPVSSSPAACWGGGGGTSEGGGDGSRDAEWVVAAVRPGGPADASGAVRLGDRVASVNGYPLQARARPAPRRPASVVLRGGAARARARAKGAAPASMLPPSH
jgi:hypothetical protein